MEKRRVVITGLGAITPIGIGVEAFWDGIKTSKNGIKPITLVDPTAHSVRFAGEISEFKAEDFIDKKESRRMDRFVQFAVVASEEALKHSRLEINEETADRIGVVIGVGVGGLATWETEHDKFIKGGPDRVSPFLIPMMITNMASGHVSIRTGARGPNTCVVSACTSSMQAIGVAFDMIARGDADAMLTGGSEAPISDLGIAGFANMRALSKRNDDYLTASRPFDKDRDGFVMGEGAATIVIEELEHAKARGATIYGEIMGYGWAGEGYHMTNMREDGFGYVRCMELALRNSGVDAAQIGYINAHGTSTPTNDPIETRAIKTVFGERAYQIPVSSNKSQVGHVLGGTGAIETVATVLALQEQIVPPTINLFEPDPQCDLDYVPNKARPHTFEYAVNNATGFGGHYAALILKKWSE